MAYVILDPCLVHKLVGETGAIIVYRASCYRGVQDLLSPTCSTIIIVFGASCYNCNNARAVRTYGSVNELCPDND